MAVLHRFILSLVVLGFFHIPSVFSQQSDNADKPVVKEKDPDRPLQSFQGRVDLDENGNPVTSTNNSADKSKGKK